MIATLALLGACGGGTGTAPVGAVPGARALASLELPGSHCPAGGARIDAGLDKNANGLLDAGEIVSTQYVCDGTTGASGATGLTGVAGAPGVTGPMGPSGLTALVHLSAQPAGAQCTSGGTNISAGADANANGLLDTAEITSIGYVCAAADGAAGVAGAAGADAHDVLMRMVAEGASLACAAGGSRVESGLDVNGNGILDAGEVGSTAHVCNGVAGSNGTNGTNGGNGTNGANGYTTLTDTIAEAPGANCAAGGTKITSGADTSRDGVLDDPAEVTATSYVCNGFGAWVEVLASTVQAQANTGYVANSGSQVTITLPANPDVGDVVRVSGAGAGGWKIAQSTGQSVLTSPLGVARIAPLWTDRERRANWRGIASSGDGTRLVAAAYGDHLNVSPDAGATWFQVDATRPWTAVASSADGRRLVAVAYSNQIYVSDDYGATWAARGSNAEWVAVASSADGRVLAAATAGHQIHVSQDYGANWTARNTDQYWSAIAISADGGRIIAAADGGTVDVSSDAGATWSTRLSGPAWRGVATSADGRVLVAVGWNVPIHISDDFGVTWVTRDSARLWNSVTSSADGSRLVAVAADDPNAAVTVLDFIYASSDQGLTWAPRGVEDSWLGVTSSADGTRLAAVTGTYGSQSLWTSAPTPVSTTTSGTGGSVSGRQYQAIELQYVGGGRFMVLGAIGSGFEVE